MKTALDYLDDLKDDAAVHIWPDDLAKCQTCECVVSVYSVRMGSPDGKTVPLFSREQVQAALQWQAEQHQFADADKMVAASIHGVPPGYVLVPVEPTEEMIEAAKGGNVVPPHLEAFFRKGLLGNWKDMLSSLPRAPQPTPFMPGEYERMTENGRKAWAGIDPQDLRSGGDRQAPQGEQWRPISEAPKDGTAVLAFWPTSDGEVHPGCYGIAAFSVAEGQWSDPDSGDIFFVDPLHWRPLPPAPPPLAQGDSR